MAAGERLGRKTFSTFISHGRGLRTCILCRSNQATDLLCAYLKIIIFQISFRTFPFSFEKFSYKYVEQAGPNLQNQNVDLLSIYEW